MPASQHRLVFRTLDHVHHSNSANGLYSLLKNKYPKILLNGAQLFSADLFKQAETTELFYTSMSLLYKMCLDSTPSPSHHFLSQLKQDGKLQRVYTQNIDGLEERAGLSTSGKSPVVVQLHGKLDTLCCTLCSHTCPFSPELQDVFREGETKPCDKCQEILERRVMEGRRPVSVGFMRPDIVLYGEHHKR